LDEGNKRLEARCMKKAKKKIKKVKKTEMKKIKGGSDRSFSFVTKTPPATILLKK
jgi:ribosomal protein L11